MNTTPTKVEELIEALNDDQKRAVFSRDGELLILAGAGTGKTLTLVSKMLYQTEVLKQDPESILALTFTNAAGLEMESRYDIYSSNSTHPVFGTFHSFCYKLICEDKAVREKLGYRDIPIIIDDIQEANVFAEAQMLTSVKLPKKAYKATYKATYEYSRKEEFEFKLFQKTVNKILISKNQITFDRLCYGVCKLFIDRDSSISNYRLKFRTIYVDEFQDTDEIQWKFVQSFIGTSNIVVCGDVRQAIYQFRGADSSIIKSLLQDKKWAKIYLEDNYRSYQEICNYANEFIRRYQDSLDDIQLKSYRGFGGSVVVSKKSCDLVSILSNIYHLDNSIAIIARSNQEVQNICSILDNCDIPYYTKVKSDEVKLYASALDSQYLESYLLSLLTEYDRARTLRLRYQNSSINLIDELSSKFKSVIEEIDELKESENFGDIQRLYELGELSLSSLSSGSIQSSGIYVGTIHSVKGLEFDDVLIYGVNGNSFNVMKSEELMNLFYVAVTRAKNRLWVLQN